MKIATFNVNGSNGRLSVLLRWLEEAAPDVFCLQELKAPGEGFPVREVEEADYGAIWHGQKRPGNHCGNQRSAHCHAAI